MVKKGCEAHAQFCVLHACEQGGHYGGGGQGWHTTAPPAYGQWVTAQAAEAAQPARLLVSTKVGSGHDGNAVVIGFSYQKPMETDCVTVAFVHAMNL